MCDKPFIHKFTNKKREKYIYCVNTNRIMKVSEIVYSLIEYFRRYRSRYVYFILKKKYPIEIIEMALNQLKQINKESGFASENRPRELKLKTDKDEYHYRLYNELNSITLNVTNNCNMKCTYCIYGNLYNDRRKRSPGFMSLDTAKRAVDLLFKYSKNSDKANIGFYGGEPLVNFDIIKDTVKYAQEKNDNNGSKNLVFHMTTNGTLLDKDKIKWAIDNKVRLLISFDGPKEIHDRYRTFNNGKGTYDLIINNLLNIRNMDEHYYRMNVDFNMVIAPPVNLKKILNYCNNHDIFNNGYNFKGIEYDDKDYFKILNEDYKSSYEYQSIIFVMRYMKYYISNNLNNNQKRWLKNTLDSLYVKCIVEREIFNQFNKSLIVNICNIGVTRSFISTDGFIYPCERVKQFNYLKIGDVYNGFYNSLLYGTKNYEIINAYFEIIESECINCWAYRFCSARSCIKIAYGKKGLSKDLMRKQCNILRNNIEFALNLYIYFEERYPNSLNKLFTEILKNNN